MLAAGQAPSNGLEGAQGKRDRGTSLKENAVQWVLFPLTLGQLPDVCERVTLYG